MMTHGGEHDGLPDQHPSCLVHFAGTPNDPACRVVPSPDLTGRLAFCASYGHTWGRNAGPIYPDDKTRNDGQCSHDKGCFCIVPSSMTLPFFQSPAASYDIRCAVRWEGPTPGPGYDAQGYCKYRELAHDASRGRGKATHLRLVTVRYPKGRCGQCSIPIPVGAVAEWSKDADSRGSLYHLIDQCPPLSHRFEPRQLGQDIFYCGCSGWD